MVSGPFPDAKEAVELEFYPNPWSKTAKIPVSISKSFTCHPLAIV
jgi:hypothetical protein